MHHAGCRWAVGLVSKPHCCSLSTDLSGLTLTNSGPSSALMVKDEYDFDGQQSMPSIEGALPGHSLQTIQHPPSSSRPTPSETFATPTLLPPTEASTSASAPSFPAIAAGSGSKIQHRHITIVHRLVLVFTDLWSVISSQVPPQPGPGTYPTTPTVIYSTIPLCHIQHTTVSIHCYYSCYVIPR